MSTYVQGVAVPYGVATLVAERAPDGGLQLFREQFSQSSWAELPDRVALTKTHNEDQPLGWCRTRNTKAGLMFEAELIESTMAADAMAAVKAGLIRGLSIAFAEDINQDQWQRGGKGQPPLVHRRGAVLRHVALVANPCYPSAQVSSIGGDTWAHQESEAVMAPYREQRARAAAASRAQSAKILADTERICRSVPIDLSGAPIDLSAPVAGGKGGGAPETPGALGPQPGAHRVAMAHSSVTIGVADLYQAETLAEQYLDATMQALRSKGSSLTRAEMDEIRDQYRVLA